MSEVRDGWGRSHRHHPIRRLTSAECDVIEYAGPLVLAEQQMRFIVGPWRATKTFVITHHSRGVVWEGSHDELRARGITLDGSPV
ncbi:MAG: hypothetical protein R2706_20365 [Acidimicrobiales bacterium]